MGSKIVAGVTLCLVVAGALPSMAQQQPTGTWATESGGSNFYYGGSASDNTYLFIFGGYQPGVSPSGAYYRATRRYDPVSNTWTTLADMPQDCYYNAGAFYSGQLFSFGNAYYGNGAIYRYTISSNTWTTLGSSLSNSRFYARAGTLGDRIYIVGGGYYSYSNLCDEFNPANSSITQRATMPSQLYGSAVAGVESLGKLYVVGGNSPSGYAAVCYEYTPSSNSWATRASMNNQSGQAQGRMFAIGVNLNNRIYVIGGYNNGYMNTTYEYNPLTDQWAQRANMANTRYLHGGAGISNKAYMYGGIPSYSSCEEYTPPNFGSPPNIPTGLGQSGSRAETALQALDDTSQFNGWTNNQVTFSADITDPDAAQQVRLLVQIKPENVAQWTSSQVVSLATPLGAQGTRTLNWTIPAGGGYDWRWRVEDAFANSYPLTPNTWVEAFGTLAAPNTESPDFRSDQLSPTDPVGLYPADIDIQVVAPDSGPVTLVWIEATDNGPVAGISYELQVARDGGFLDIEAQLFSQAGQDQYPITLSVSRFPKFWRIRARDVGGNFSQWSQPLTFRVTYNDGIDHSAGDAEKNCGFNATAIPSLGAALAGVLALGFALLRRRR